MLCADCPHLDATHMPPVWKPRATCCGDVKPTAAGRPREFLNWAVEMFGPVALERQERLDRFVEEAIELAHAEGMDILKLRRIIDRVWSRQRGHTSKEIGQTQACLETFAESIGLSSDDLAQVEWSRVQTIPKEEWQRRHAAKAAVGIAAL